MSWESTALFPSLLSHAPLSSSRLHVVASFGLWDLIGLVVGYVYSIWPLSYVEMTFQSYFMIYLYFIFFSLLYLILICKII